MNYVNLEKDAQGRKWMDKVTVDLRRFATDLAAELGGAVYDKPNNEYPNERQYITLGDDLLSVAVQYSSKKVNVYIEAPEVPWGDRNTYDKEARTEDATINPDARPIKTIAKDIKRRVVDASQPALARQREYAKRQQDNRNNIALHIHDLRVACPTLDVRRRDEKDQTAAVFNGSGGHYLNGTLHSDGTVSVERIGSLPLHKFMRLVDLLNSKDET